MRWRAWRFLLGDVGYEILRRGLLRMTCGWRGLLRMTFGERARNGIGGKITPILTFPHQGGRDKRGGGLPVAFAVFPNDVAEAGEGEVAGDDGNVFVFDGFEEGAAGLVGEGPVVVEVTVPMVFGDLGGMDENVALDEGLLALGGDEDAHVARGVSGGVDGADFRGEVGVFREGVEEAEFDEALDGGFHEGDGLFGLDFGQSKVVEVFLVNDVAGVGEGGDEFGLSCSMVFQPTWSLCRWERKTVSTSWGWTFWARRLSISSPSSPPIDSMGPGP